MSTRSGIEHAYFARVPNRLLADLRSASGPILTFVEADGQLHVNQAALQAGARGRRGTGNTPGPVVVPPFLFIPAPPLSDQDRSHDAAKALPNRRLAALTHRCGLRDAPDRAEPAGGAA